jgi:obg-like ATPase 1
MPPKGKKGKKGATEEKKLSLGRPGNTLKMGIVGLPNIGKSSLFNVLSGLNVPSDNRPFCTIDPTEARVPVPDDRFDHLCAAFKPKSEVSAVLSIFDIAGLVKGASNGDGLGNAFLSHIVATDAIYHVCRAFAGKSIAHVEGDVDPVRDLQIISDELCLKDLEWVTARKEALQKLAKRGLDKTAALILPTFEKAEELLLAGKDIRSWDWKHDDIVELNKLQLLTAKPVVYLVNISDKNFRNQGNKWLKLIKEWVEARNPGAPIIPFSATWEAAFARMSPEEQKEAMDNGGKKLKSMIPKIIKTGYKHLGLINYFTCGEDEVRAWTIQNGVMAPGAAGVIHTDFEKLFLQAEQYSFDDFKEFGDESAVKKAGKVRTQGKNYVVQDGDILFFKTAAAKKGGKK